MKQTGTVAVLEWCLIFFLLSAQGLAQNTPPGPPAWVTVAPGVEVWHVWKTAQLPHMNVAILRLTAVEHGKFKADPPGFLKTHKVFDEVLHGATLNEVWHFRLGELAQVSKGKTKAGQAKKPTKSGDPLTVCAHNDYSYTVCTSE